MKYILILMAFLALAACDSGTPPAPETSETANLDSDAKPAGEMPAADAKTADEMPAANANAPASADGSAALESPEQRFGYAVGLQVGESLTGRDFDGDVDALVQGLRDAFEGTEPRLAMEDLQAAMTAARERAQARATEAAAEAASAGTAFLEKKKTEGFTATDSGLLYKVVTAGTGASPKPTDTVSVHYRGTLIDGTEFDSSYTRGEPATFPVNGVIQGWQEVLPMMKTGGKWNVVIPAALAYGERGAGGVIGPNETLQFEIELLEIQAPEAKAEAEKAEGEKAEAEPKAEVEKPEAGK